MARTINKVQVNNFVGGLVTDYHELNTPQNVTTDEDNCDIDRKGSRRRRKGIEFEQDYTLAAGPAPAVFDDYYIKTHEWGAVANDGLRNFLVVQVGPTLYFFDKSSEPLSDGVLGFQINLDSHLAPAQSSTADEAIQVASGKGALFVVGRKIIPFYVEYDAAADTIAETEIELRIRDFDEQDQALSNDAMPPTITDKRKYDLFNQGWDAENIRMHNDVFARPYDEYFTEQGVYPPKTKPWFFGKTAGSHGHEIFEPETYDIQWGGNTLAALGHYILDPFSKDRATASGIAGLVTETELDRPSSVAFFAGHVFYGFENQVFFSQLIKDSFSVVGKCYQDADPTSETVSDLIATDGGVIQINESGSLVSLFSLENSLIMFSTNGIWTVQGGSVGEGFAATGFSVLALSSVNTVSFRTICNVEGFPTFWGDNGIYLITPKENVQGYQVVNLLEKKIQNFYDAIPALSKTYASGVYDKIRKQIVWIFSETAPAGNRFICDRVLNFDITLTAFFPYTLSDLVVNSPVICDVFQIRSLVTSRQQALVTSSGGQVTSNSGQDVYVYEFALGAPNTSTGGVKYLTFWDGP